MLALTYGLHRKRYWTRLGSSSSTGRKLTSWVQKKLPTNNKRSLTWHRLVSVARIHSPRAIRILYDSNLCCTKTLLLILWVLRGFDEVRMCLNHPKLVLKALFTLISWVLRGFNEVWCAQTYFPWRVIPCGASMQTCTWYSYMLTATGSGLCNQDVCVQCKS